MFLRRLLQELPRSELRRALAHMQRGEFQAAAQLFEVVVGSAESHDDVAAYACEAYVEAAKEHLERGALDAAQAALERGAELRPKYADVHFQLGRLHEKRAHPQRASAAYRRAIDINPRYIEARLALARLQMELRESGDALRNLQLAAESGPRGITKTLQEIVSGAPPGEVQSTIALQKRLRTLLDSLQQSPVGDGIRRAQEALREGNGAAAIGELKRLLKSHPRFPDLHNLLGVAYDHQDMLDDALEEFELALRYNPDYIDARINLAFALQDRGRHAEAESHLRLLARKHPGHRVVEDAVEQMQERERSS